MFKGLTYNLVLLLVAFFLMLIFLPQKSLGYQIYMGDLKNTYPATGCDFCVRGPLSVNGISSFSDYDYVQVVGSGVMSVLLVCQNEQSISPPNYVLCTWGANNCGQVLGSPIGMNCVGIQSDGTQPDDPRNVPDTRNLPVSFPDSYKAPCKVSLSDKITLFKGVWDKDSKSCVQCDASKHEKIKQAFSAAGSVSINPFVCEEACGADPVCDERLSGKTDYCDGFVSGNSKYNDYCNSNCKAVPGTFDTACGADSRCQGLTQGANCNFNGQRGQCDQDGQCRETQESCRREGTYDSCASALGNRYLCCIKTGKCAYNYCGEPGNINPGTNQCCDSNCIGTNQPPSNKASIISDGGKTCNFYEIKCKSNGWEYVSQPSSVVVSHVDSRVCDCRNDQGTCADTYCELFLSEDNPNGGKISRFTYFYDVICGDNGWESTSTTNYKTTICSLSVGDKQDNFISRADINDNGKVDLTDLVMLANAYSSTCACPPESSYSCWGVFSGCTYSPNWDPDADIMPEVPDGKVNLQDLVFLAINYGVGC
jgi:hypothetical protein